MISNAVCCPQEVTLRGFIGLLNFKFLQQNKQEMQKIKIENVFSEVDFCWLNQLLNIDAFLYMKNKCFLILKLMINHLNGQMPLNRLIES